MALPIDILIILNVFGFALLFVLLYVTLMLYFKVKDANRDYEKLLDFDEKLKEDLGKRIEEIVEERVTKLIAGLVDDIDSKTKRELEQMANHATAKSAELSEYLTKLKEDQLKESQYFVANSLEKIEKELESYRKTKLAKVDEEIRQIVLTAAREVIGRAISLSEHEDLVTKALERAKKERIFT